MAAVIDIFSRQLSCPVVEQDCPIVAEVMELTEDEEVSFLLSTRADTSLFNRWERVGYEVFCRQRLGKYLPKGWTIPAIPPMYLAVFETFAEADDNCLTPDDKIVILPKGHTYHRDCVDAEVFCRPRDRTDTKNYLRLRSKYDTPKSISRAVIEQLSRNLGVWMRVSDELKSLVERLESAIEALERLPLTDLTERDNGRDSTI
jgi:hypothetical protein